MFCFCVFVSFVCVCLLVLEVVVYVFAFVCCNIAFHATCVSIACVFCVRVFCLFVCVCMHVFAGDCVSVCRCTSQCCVADHLCVDFMRVLLSCCWFVCLCLFA